MKCTRQDGRARAEWRVGDGRVGTGKGPPSDGCGGFAMVGRTVRCQWSVGQSVSQSGQARSGQSRRRLSDGREQGSVWLGPVLGGPTVTAFGLGGAFKVGKLRHVTWVVRVDGLARSFPASTSDGSSAIHTRKREREREREREMVTMIALSGSAVNNSLRYLSALSHYPNRYHIKYNLHLS